MSFEIPSINFVFAAPVITVAVTGMVIMLLDLIAPQFVKRWVAWIAALGLILALVQTISVWSRPGSTFTPAGGHAMLMADNFATFLNIAFIITGLLTILISYHFLERTKLGKPEFYMLMLLSISGMMLMGMAHDFLLIFLALGLLSIPLYILSGFAWPRTDSEESAMKYFLLGAFSSGVFVFGIALTYGATGSTALPEVVANAGSGGSLIMAGVALMLVGLGFKVAAVPFHMWTPDVYEGAPTAVTAFMSVGSKIGGFAALLRVLMVALPTLGDAWAPAIAVLAALTLIVGNVVAIAQQNIKRILAYSSIAHAGYILIAIAATVKSADGVSAALFYMFAYLFTNLGAFAIVIAMERKQGEGVLLDDYKGLAKRSPILAMVMAYFMLSLTGVPPTGGFSGKFYVFRAAIEADLIWLAVIGVITSAVSGFYYLRIVYLMFMFEGKAELKPKRALLTAVAITAAVTLFLGFFPSPGFEFAREAVIQGAQTLLAGG